MTKLKNRTAYADYGLMFAKEPEDLQTPKAALGQAIRTLSERKFAKVCEAAGVRRVVFHGLRHTSATLLLQAGISIPVVSQRLGHAKTSMTLDIYAHALPSAQREAAAMLDSVLAGG